MDTLQRIEERCRVLGIDRLGLQSVRNFIAAAFHHVSLPGTLPADVHLAYNTGIRHATSRIGCGGRHGRARELSRVLSRRALKLRQAVLAEALIEPRRKLGAWSAQVTEEHQEPALAVEQWIRAHLPAITVDDVVLRLLEHPPVIVTRQEERAIPGAFRTRGTPAERYRAAGIEPVLAEENAVEFFRSRLSLPKRQRRGKYEVERQPFDAKTVVDVRPQLECP